MVSKYISPDSCNTIVTPHANVFSSILQLRLNIKNPQQQRVYRYFFKRGLTDVTTQAQIVRQMMELRDTYGTSIIVVPHNLGVAACMSDNIVVMRHGKIEDQGGWAHILSHSENAYTRTLLDAVPSLGGMRYV